MTNLAMQTTLPLTENNSFAKILENEFPDLNINIFVSARLKTWRIERDGYKKNRYSLKIPCVLLNADDKIKTALLKWAYIIVSNQFSRKKAKISVKKQIKDLENLIYDYLKNETNIDLRRRHFNSKEKFKNTKGVKFDLSDVFNKINNDFFNGDLDCFLRWGRGKSKTSYHTVCVDENGNSFHLITIAGSYNRKSTPDFAIEAVMYHEMLHIAIPPINTNIKRSVHHRQFREMEKQFPYYKEWKAWQKTLTKRVFFK
jgi:hypothetical protein